MPIYEYQCNSCKASFEVMQKISDGPPDQCPYCGHNELTKLISKVGFKLKGTGWYETDFKDKKSGGKEEKTTKPNTEKQKSKQVKNEPTKSKKSVASGEVK